MGSGSRENNGSGGVGRNYLDEGVRLVLARVVSLPFAYDTVLPYC